MGTWACTLFFSFDGTRTKQVRHPRRRIQQNGDGIWHPWRQVCSCSDTTCLDPSTLGVSKLLADYRVRAQGPGGVGPWSELLRVDTLAKTLRRSNSARSKDENDVSDGRGRSGSGNGNDPGTRNRDPREELGHLPRTTSQRTQLNINMSPPSSTVSALLSPAAEAAAAASMVASEHLYKRAGGSKKLLWGTLANPRSAHRRHDVAAAAELEAMTGNEIYGWFPPALCGLDAAEDKIVSGSEGAEGCVGLSSREIEEARSSCTAVGTVVSGGTDEVPPEVALMLRKQVDLSIGFIGPGRVSSARLGSKHRWDVLR